MNEEAVYAQKGFYLGSILSILLILAGLISAPASAQSGIGSIEGTVADSTGAVVPGAAIHVVNLATQTATDTKSNGVGFFQVPGLFTGTYSVSVSAPGMKTYQTSIELLVAQTAVINPMLSLGAQTQQVTVNASEVQLTTSDSPSISSTLENQRINQLPMNGRDITTTLTATTPGMENGGDNINGMAPEALDYVVDGAIANDDNSGSSKTTNTQLVDPDSIQEVHVESSNGSAEYATPATVIVSTRSGTNHLHGTMFETARNNAFGVARNRQAAQAGSGPTPELIRNEFGASAGGPVIIPHVYHGRDRTFWFFAYERYSLAQQTAGLASVPTYGTPGNSGVGSGMNNGDFSSLVNAKGVLQVLYNPATTASSNSCAATSGKNTYCRTPFANNQIPVTSESPFAKIYYQLMPHPNIASVTNPLIGNNLSYTAPTYDVVGQETARIDHSINESNKLSLRFSTINAPDDISGGPDNLAVTGIAPGAALGYTNNQGGSDTGILEYTHIFSPTFFAETSLNMQWFSNHKLSGVNSTVNYESMLGLPNNFGEVGFPAVNGVIEPLTGSQNANNANSQIISTATENLTKTIGRHQLFFGGRFYHQRDYNKPAATADTIANGVFATGVYQPTSGTKYTALTSSGYADGSFFLGSPTSYKVNLAPRNPHYHLDEIDAYVQDNFHVSKKLTLNLGLRYEAHPALWTKFGLDNTFDLKNDALVLAAPPAELISEGYTTQAIITNDQNIGIKFETPQQAGMPVNTLMDNYNLIFLPRIGVAWMPFHTGTVIRGGFGQYMYHQPLEDYANHPEANNPLTAAYTQSYITAAQAYDGLADEQLRYNSPVQFGVMGANSSGAVNSTSTNSITPGVALFSVNPDWKPTEVSETNFTIEQPLPGRAVLRATYLYSRTANIDVDNQFNNGLSNYQWEMATGTIPPTGGASVIGTPQQNTYSTTAENAYDQTTWGTIKYHSKTGWANYNALQLNYQRLYHHGFAYQLSYVYGKQMAMGGDTADASSSNGDQAIYPDADYPGVLGSVGQMSLLPGSSTPFVGQAPPPRPSNLPDWEDYHAMDVYQGYLLDPSIPKLDIKFNGILDLPVGKGKWLMGNSSRWLDEIVGGYQIAGLGSVVSQVFQPATGNNGPVAPIQVNKTKVPIVDCRNGACLKGYEWFNGYLSPSVQGSGCTSNCVTGLPSTYQPFQTPINNNPAYPTYYGDNDVNVTIPGSAATSIAYDIGPNGGNYTSKTYLNGPINWNADLSLFKVFPIREQMNLRVNFDAFNAFNHQGNVNPDSTAGLEEFTKSANTARELQITARFSF